ncbi:FAD-dependent oxidoreductase [Nonomuraea sp. NPDC046802]|uniref:FAD-dependent oxidoreductase n=1 Tax=Nonomuraea sp. NPDC046802 TaxID=3154919 RepID=UPI0033ED4888
MRSVAVIGTGTVGSMALWRLAERGIPAVGFDAYAPGHDRGAAGGESRIFRTAYKEGPAYVPLLRQARALWEELGRSAGRRLLTPVGGVTVGPRDHPKIRAVLESARAHDLPVEVLTGNDRVPEHPLRDGEIMVVDREAGYLRPEASVVAAAAAAERAGARIAGYTPVKQVKEDADGVTVLAQDGEHRFSHVVMTPGPWARALLPGLALSTKALTSTWFPRRDESLFEPDTCPIAIRVGEPAYSCFPAVDGVGVKVNLHLPWQEIGSPDDLARSVPVAYVEQVARAVAHLVLTVPYAVRLVLAGLAGLDRAAEKAAAGLGAAPFLVFWHLTLPAVRGALIGGAFFAFITSFDDLTVALFVVTTDLQTLPVRIFNYMQYDYDPTVTAIGTLMVVFAAVAVVVIERFAVVAKLFGADQEHK